MKSNNTTGKIKKAVSVVLAAVMLMVLCACSQKPESLEGLLIEDSADMFEFGNLYFDIPADTFLTHFELGDIVTVTVDGCEPLDVPVCASFDDVSAGELLLRVRPGKDHIALAINYGQVGITLGVLELTESDSCNRLTIRSDVKLPLKMTVTLKEKGGYKDRLALSELVRPDDRNEYAVSLTDEQFANFRAIETTGMSGNVLYRSSTPIDDEIGRNKVADALMAKSGIKTVINLADSEAEAAEYPDFAGSYYSGRNVLYCALPAAFTIKTYSDGFADALRYMITHEGPYLIHCTEGKDRTGFASAVLELFMGASLDEVKADYLATYENYFAELKDGGVQLDDNIRLIICGIIENNLELAYGIEDISSIDTRKATEDYLRSIGLSDRELSSLRECLG